MGLIKLGIKGALAYGVYKTVTNSAEKRANKKLATQQQQGQAYPLQPQPQSQYSAGPQYRETPPQGYQDRYPAKSAAVGWQDRGSENSGQQQVGSMSGRDIQEAPPRYSRDEKSRQEQERMMVGEAMKRSLRDE